LTNGKHHIIGKGDVQKTKFLNKKGVYILRSKETKAILYIGMSDFCVYKAFYRHFHFWKDTSSRKRFNKTGTECRLIETTKEDAHKLEVRLIRYFQPVMNGIMYTTEDPEQRSTMFECGIYKKKKLISV